MTSSTGLKVTVPLKIVPLVFALSGADSALNTWVAWAWLRPAAMMSSMLSP